MTTHSDTRWFERLQELFARAVDVDPTGRATLLEQVAAESPELLSDLRALIEAHERHAGRTGDHQLRVRETAASMLGGADGTRAGTRIGPYELREELGRGGMGVVFRAERVDGKVKQDVAIKIVNRALLGPRARERFALERDIVAGFEHPYIARLYDVGETTDGSPCMIMERIDGEPITAYADRARLPIRARLELFLKVCEAVQHAHARLVLHRDLKPSNILVTADSTPKLIDFGIAKPIAPDDAHATGTHERFFSPTNAAPEQVCGERVGVACDVYQLGTVLYELLCGGEVFDATARTAAELEQRILSHVPPAPSQRAVTASVETALARDVHDGRVLARQLRGDLDNVVLHALRKAPTERYASVEQLADDVRRHLERRPIAARLGQGGYRLRKFVARNRLAVAAAAAGALLISAFVTAILLQSQRLKLERDGARLERDRADKSAQFMVDVFTSADPAQGMDRTKPIGDVLDNGRQLLEYELRDEPDLRVRLLGVLAEIYNNLNDPQTARRLLDEAGGVLAEHGPIDDRGMVEFLVHRASVLRDHSDLAAAEDARQAIAIQTRLGDSPGKQWEARRVLMMVTLKGQDRASWAPAFAELLRDMEHEPSLDPKDVTRIRKEVGHNLALDSKPAEAEPMIRQALAELERAYPSDHPEVLNARVSLANLLNDHLGRSVEALELCQSVLVEYQRRFGRRSPVVAQLMVRTSRPLRSLERYDEAMALLSEARDIFTETRTWPHGDFTVVEWDIGEVLLDRGELDVAAQHFAESLRSAEEVQGPTAANAVMVRAKLGAVRAKQGRLDEAERLLREAVEASSFEWFGHAEPGIDYAEVLHRIGRDADARAMLDRVQHLLDQNPEASKPLARRVAALRGALDRAPAASQP